MIAADDGKFAGFIPECKLLFAAGRDVWHLVPYRQKLAYAGATVLMAFASACNVAFPLLLGQLVDRVRTAVPDRDGVMGAAAVTLGLIAGLYVGREIIGVLRRAMVEAASTKLEQRLTVAVIGRLMRTDLSRLTHERTGAIQGRISRSVVGTVRFVRLVLLDLLPPLATGTFAVVAAFSKDYTLALAMLGVAPVSLWLTVRQIASQKGVRLNLIRGREQIDGAVTELIGGLDYVRAAGTDAYEITRFDTATRHLRATEQRHHFEMSLYGAGRAFNEGFFHVLVLGLGVYLAADGQISYGDILTASLLFMSVMAPLNEVHRALDEGHECSLQVNDLRAMLAHPEDASYATPDAPPITPAPGAPLLAADGLVVEYPTPAGPRRVLDGVRLHIRHGETIGLAGPSGCGKTTLLRILLRLTHPSAGAVQVCGVNLADLPRADIGRLIGYVGQNPFVFNGTVADNISYGVPDATPEAIAAAAQMAHIHDEILAMPGGYQARVAERGANLSGGQRQRLALARVLLKNPPVLVLDEGTSALDTISERQVKLALDRARADRTVILVAHRLSTLKDADRILVFRDGRLAEEGSYAELAVRGGVFTELVRSADEVTAA